MLAGVFVAGCYADHGRRDAGSGGPPVVRMDSGRPDAGHADAPVLRGFRATGTLSFGCPTSPLYSGEEAVTVAFTGLLELHNPTAELLSAHDAVVVFRAGDGPEHVVPVGLYDPHRTVVALEEPVVLEPRSEEVFVFQIFTAEGQRQQIVEGVVAEDLCAWTCEDVPAVTRFELNSSQGRLSASFEMEGVTCQ